MEPCCWSSGGLAPQFTQLRPAGAFFRQWDRKQNLGRPSIETIVVHASASGLLCLVGVFATTPRAQAECDYPFYLAHIAVGELHIRHGSAQHFRWGVHFAI